MSELLPESLAWLIRAWGNWMAGMSLHVTLLVCLLWILDRPLRSTSARLRFMLWLLVLARLIVPPDLAAPTGIAWWTGGWFSQQSQAVASGLGLNLGDGLLPSAGGAVDTSAGSHGSEWNSALVTTGPWWSGLFFVWCGFVLGYLGFMCLGWLQIRSWLRQASPLSDMATKQILASALKRVGLKRVIEVRDSGMCSTPLVIGWLRPVILLPTSVHSTLRPAELESVLVHELMHVARHDAGWRFLQAILGAIYFFHPAVWFARRMLQRYCEEACDEQTIAALAGERRHYAEAILKAAMVVGYQPPYLAMNMLGDALPIKRRLQRILDPALPLRSGGHWARFCLACVLALLLLPTGFKSSQATPPDQLQPDGLRLSQADGSDNSQLAEPLSIPLESADSSKLASSAGSALDLERQALGLLKSTEFDQRMSGYETLERVGTLQSLPFLEAAFLQRSGIEQDAAKRALDRVWLLVRSMSTQSNHSSRMFESPAER